MNRYFSTQRPVSPGSYPPGDVDCVVDFPDRVYCEEIGRDAWGYIDYRYPVDPQKLKDYELIEGR